MATGAGAFGKMPALGDFFRIRAGADFVGVWDAWLQEVMLTLRQSLGSRYEDCYMTAPVWQFVLPAGLAGPAALAGVLMPSVDRVGRQFPLTLMAELPAPDATPLRQRAAQTALLDALEDLALDTLGDEMTRDSLDERLAALAPVTPPPQGMVARGPAGGLIMQGGNPALLFPDLADTVLSLGKSTIWTCTVDGAARMITVPGLPRGTEALALFDLDAAIWAEPVA